MSSQAPLKLLVLLSGTGSNFAALQAACTDPSSALHALARITFVISNRKEAKGLTELAPKFGIPSRYHNLFAYKKAIKAKASESTSSAEIDQQARREYDADLAKIILEQAPDVVVCAGWMHILSPSFLEPLEAAGIDIINLHPALPGQFDGKDAIKRAYEAFGKGEIKETGIMIHRVISEVDRGEPIVVEKVEIKEGDSLEELETRIHQVEHEAIVRGTVMICKERLEKKL